MGSSGADGGGGRGEEPRWGRAPEDLFRSDDDTRSLLRACRRGQAFGVERPLLGGFPLIARIGKGGMGAVFLGWHPHLHQQVAIKVLPRTEYLARFQREARLAAALRSSHLVHVHHFDRDEPSGLYYLVMEFLVGRPAGEWAAQEKARTGAVSEDAALDVLIAACRGLSSAHAQGVIHRDVKPDNLFVPDDKQGRPQPTRTKVIDLGLALSLTTQHRLTSSGCALGTPGFMPPEQCLSAFHTTPASDVFSLGATLYDLLTGTPPFPTDAIRALLETPSGNYVPIGDRRGDVSTATRALVAKCLERDPEARFADAAALQAALEQAKGGLSRTAVVAAPVAGSPQPAPRRAVSRRGVVLAGVIVLVAGAAFAGASVLGGAAPSRLEIDSLPAGAEVRVDDRVVGRTPLAGLEIAPGDHTIEVRADEHEPWKSPLRVAPGAAKRFGRIALQPWGSLDLTEITPGVEVWLGGRRLADGARVPPTPQKLVLRKAGQPDQDVTVLAPLSVRVKPAK